MVYAQGDEKMDEAERLNNVLDGTAAGELLSDMGRRMYWPKGIIAQGQEAKTAKVNATIGMTVVNGEVAILPSIQADMAQFAPHEVVAYAPTAGMMELRKTWQQQMIAKNPALQDVPTSLPVVTPGLTAAISYVADLFLDSTHPLLVPEPAWDNYQLVVKARRGSELLYFSAFKYADGQWQFNLDAMRQALTAQAKSGQVRLLLNFPQNPSGFSPSHALAMQIIALLKEIADGGTKILVLCDDAYFGLNYECDIEQQSLFAYLAQLHENILAIKADGPTKEDFAWGFRCGFLTFAERGLSDVQYDALVKKLMAAIRSSVSCSSTPTQSILIREFQHPRHEQEKLALKLLLQRRYQAVRSYVDSHKSDVLSPLPFNSGYFMSFALGRVKDGPLDIRSNESLTNHGVQCAELLRQRLLKRGIGVVAISTNIIRVAFSSIDEADIISAYDAIYQEAANMASEVAQ